jgi:hypothetical protein
MRKSFALIAVIIALAAIPALSNAQALPTLFQDDMTRINMTGAWVHSFNTRYSYERSEAPFLLIRTGDWSYNYDSFQLGLGIPFVLGAEGSLGTFVVGGTITIPSISSGEEALRDNAGNLTEFRKWSADTYYATVEGLWAYPVTGGWSALAGFRWICWQTSYDNVSSLHTTLPDKADVTVNGYVPFLGVMTNLFGLNIGAGRRNTDRAWYDGA